MDKIEENNTRVIVDETTIYEIDIACYRCLSERQKQRYFNREERQKIEG